VTCLSGRFPATPPARSALRIGDGGDLWGTRAGALSSYVFEECSLAELGLERETIGPIPELAWDQPDVHEPG
jgi:hypothetical protein